MRIYNLNINYFTNYQQKNIQKNYSTDTVSFTSKNFLKQSSEKISEQVINAINIKNRLGFGSQGTVYKIPDTDYCIKILKKTNSINFGTWNFNISEQDKINHIVAKAKNKATIMKYIEGVPLQWENSDKILELPNESYIKLFTQLTEARNLGMNFDLAPSNIIYNPKTNSLTAIDFYQDDNPFSIITSVYKALIKKSFSESDKLNNRKFGGKLINIIIDELTKEKEPRFLILRNDIGKLLETISRTQEYNIPKQILYLENSLNKLLLIKEHEHYCQEVLPSKILGEIKYSKCIINQILNK